jgi:hypothetical protein
MFECEKEKKTGLSVTPVVFQLTEESGERRVYLFDVFVL